MSDSTIINIIVTVLAIMVLVLGTGLFLLVKELKWQKACIESQDYRLQDLERLEELRIVSSEPAESSRTIQYTLPVHKNYPASWKGPRYCTPVQVPLCPYLRAQIPSQMADDLGICSSPKL